MRENVVQRKQKFGQLRWSERYFFMEHNYHKEFGDAELRQSRCLPGENYCFFSLRYYSWKVGKERRKLRVEGSIHCFAQSLRRPLLPSEEHFHSKVWGDLISNATSISKQNQEASLPLVLESKKEARNSRVFNVPHETWKLNASGTQTSI